MFNNKKMRLLRCALDIVCIALLVQFIHGCKMAQPEKETDHIEQEEQFVERRYFKSLGKYKIPFQPEDEISLNEAGKMKVYFEANFSEDGQIISLRRYFDGKMEWEYRYFYEGGVVIKGEMHKTDGGVVVHSFDKKGRLIK